MYKDSDLILADLVGKQALGRATRVRVELTDSDVKLYVGKRDWQWDRKTRKLIGKGISLI